MTRRPRLLLLLTALLVIAAVVLLRPQFAPSPPEHTPAGASTLEEPEPGSTAAATASASATGAPPDERHGPKKREGVDAANLYAEAFVLFDRLTDEEKAMLRKPSEEVDAEKAAQLFEKIQAIMALLRAAAQADYCDWGTGEITFETSLSHIGNAQDLGKLALWAAAYRFSTDPAGAIDDLGVRARLGHHLTDTLIGILVAGSFEATAHNLVRDRLTSLDTAATSKALEFVRTSTLDSNLTRAMNGEMTAAESWWKRLESMDARDRGKAILTMGSSEKGNLWDSAKQFAIGIFFSPHRIAEEIAFIRSVHERAANAMRLPEAEFQIWWRGVESELTGTNSLARAALPTLDGVQRKMQQLRVERTLLTAGSDVLQNGPAQIGRYRDPATDGALIHVPTPTGFELRSPYQVKGKPVTMTFRRPTLP